MRFSFVATEQDLSFFISFIFRAGCLMRLICPWLHCTDPPPNAHYFIFWGISLQTALFWIRTTKMLWKPQTNQNSIHDSCGSACSNSIPAVENSYIITLYRFFFSKAAPHKCVFALRWIFFAISGPGKFEMHTVFLHASSLDLTKNLSPNRLCELYGAALKTGLANN